MGYGTEAIVFLINVIFGTYLIAVMLRFILQLVRADFHNPVSQFLYKVTNPPLIPLRRIIPGFMGVDMASVLLMFCIQMMETFLVQLVLNNMPGFGVLLAYSFISLIKLATYVFIFAIVIQVIISWINPGVYNPVVSLLYSITEPVLKPFRRMIPPISGFDLSPLVALVVLQVSLILVTGFLSELLL